MVIIFLVLWSISLSSSLVHFKNGPEYLTKETAQVFIRFIRLQLFSLISSNFLILLRYSFLIFSFISNCLMVSASNIVKYFYVSFSSGVLIFSWFGRSILSVMSRFPLFIISMAHFLSQIPSLCLGYILTACIRVSNSFSFLLRVWCRPCTLGDCSFLAIS